MVHLFIGGAVTSESNTPTSNDVDFGAPDFWSDELFFRDEVRNKLDADMFYDAVETLHKNATLATDNTVIIPGDEPLIYYRPGNQYPNSSDSED